MPYQLPLGLLLLIVFGGITWGAWTDNLPLGTSWRERLLVRLIGEKGVLWLYLALGGVGSMLGLGLFVWGMALLI